MNPLRRLKNFFIGEALSKTDDVFERARIELLYKFTMFFIILGLVFYGNILANKLWWQFYITTFGVITLPVVLVVLKTTGNVTYAGYVYIFNQIVMSVANQWLYKFGHSIVGGLWAMVFIVFAFFVMGRRWGFVVTGFTVLCLLMPTFNEMSGGALLSYHIPPEQVPTELPIFVLVPFLLNVFAFSQIVATRKVAEQKLQLQKAQVETNNKQLESKNKDITDSINYARKIQYAVLPNEDAIYRSIPLSFILYKPRDIVSGDFFWFHELDDKNYILVGADCTGHGVPGAFMTVIGSSLLNQVIVESKVSSPASILQEMDRRINLTLKQEKERLQTVQDGMDLALLKVDKAKKEFVFTSAKRPAVLIRDKQLQEIKGSKFSLGGMRTGEKRFEEIRMNYQEDDMIYFFSDGFTDQFGGPKGKKFSSKRLRDLLMGVHRLPMNEQKQKLDTAFESWKGRLEQIDDVLVMGIRF